MADCEGLFEHILLVSQLHRSPSGVQLRLGSILKFYEAEVIHRPSESDPSTPSVSNLGDV